jgi:PleD family two-component response regulator
MKQAPDAIYIVTMTTERAEEIKRAIVLRGFDEILCIPYENAAMLLRANPPALAILDIEGDHAKTTELMEKIPPSVKSLVLAEQFDEALFVACHDRGARDFLVKPVAEAYLVSRVIRALQEHRVEQVAAQKDEILVEMGVLSSRSGVFTTPYLLKLLRQCSEEVSPYADDPLSMLIVQLEGYQSPLPDALQNALYSEVGRIMRECARGMDAVGEFYMDKFAVVLPQTGRRGAKALGNRVFQRLHGLTFQNLAGPATLEVRFGVADYSGCRHYEDLLNRALDDLKSSEPKSNGLKIHPFHSV